MKLWTVVDMTAICREFTFWRIIHADILVGLPASTENSPNLCIKTKQKRSHISNRRGCDDKRPLSLAAGVGVGFI